MVVLIGLCFGVDFCSAYAACAFSYFNYVLVTEWPSIGKVAAHMLLILLTIFFFIIST